MQQSASFVYLRIVSYFVLLAMLAAAGYALVTSLLNWPGIGV
jgi:hypothetical protein